MKVLYKYEQEDISYKKLEEGIISEEHFDIINHIIACFEALAFKVVKKVIPIKYVIDGYSDWIIRCAQQTRIYIKDQRANRHKSENYRKRFEWLVKECKLYQLKQEGKESQINDNSLDALLKIEPLPIFKIRRI